MARSIATITGTAIKPGVSRNGRLYTHQMLRESAARAQSRIDNDGDPLTMRLNHPEPGKQAFVPVTETVGRLTKVWQADDGSVKFQAALADTPKGREVASLYDNRKGKPFVRGVSIRGAWSGPTRKVSHQGQTVETSDGLDIDGLDLTHKPGVDGAGVEDFEPDDDAMEAEDSQRLPDGRALITESVQEAQIVEVTEASAGATPKAPYGTDVVYADPGYQKDKQKRYPLDTRRHARAAWAYVNMDKNAAKYTAAQLKRVKARIMKALKRFGVHVSEGMLVERFEVTESLAEALGMDGQPGSFCASLDNGMVQVTVSSYRVDPHDLTRVGKAAMDGAIQALLAMDPDDDGDIDVAGAPADDTDHDGGGPDDDDGDEADDMEAATEATTSSGAAVTETTAHPATPDPAADPNPVKEDPAVSEATTPAAGQAAVVTFSEKQFADLLAAIRPQPVVAAATTEAATESAPEPTATEAAASAEPVVESDEQRVQRLVDERMAAQRTALIQEIAAKSGVPRKGLVTESTDAATGEVGGDGATNSHGLPAGWPDKPLHQYTDAERKQYLSGQLVGAVLGGRGTGNRAQ